MTKKWIKELYLDFFDRVRRIVVLEKQFRMKPSGEYETTNLRTPYQLLDLMLNLIFCLDNGRIYKISWAPLIYFVATIGIIFS